MKILASAAALALAASALAGCGEGPTTGTAQNNTGNSASANPERLGPSTDTAPRPEGQVAPDSKVAQGDTGTQ